MSTSLQCPMCGEPGSALHIFSGSPAKALLGQALLPWTLAVQIVLLYRTCRFLNTVLSDSTNRTLAKYVFPRRFPDKQRLTSICPDALLVVPLKREPRTNSWYLLRSSDGCGGDREHSAPATATPPASKVRHPSQLLPEQRRIHLVEVKHCEDTRPKNQLQASKQQH
eukprot:1141702-Pelagomonas_calceolata.AAC.2